MIEKSENGSYITPLGILAPNGYFIEKKDVPDKGMWENLVAASKTLSKDQMDEVSAMRMKSVADPSDTKSLNSEERIKLKNDMQKEINSKVYQTYLNEYIKENPENFKFLRKSDNPIIDKLAKSQFLQGGARTIAGDLAWLEKTGKSLVDLSVLKNKNLDSFLQTKIDINEKIKQLASNDINGSEQGTLGNLVYSIGPAFLVPSEALGEEILNGFTGIAGGVVPKGAIKALSGISSKSLAGALQGYLSMLDDENQNLGTILGAVANPILSMLPKALNLAKPIKKMMISMPKYASTLVGLASKNLDNLKKAVEASPSGHVILGKVLKDPNLLKMEMNILPGANDKFIDKFKEISKDLYGQADKIFKMLTANEGFLNIGDKISKDIKENYKKIKKNSSFLYNLRNEIADEHGIQVDSKTVLKNIEELKNQNIDAYLTGVDTLKKAGGILKKVSGAMSNGELPSSEIKKSEDSIFNTEPSEFSIFPKKPKKDPLKFSIQEAQQAKSELYDEGINARINGRRREGALFNELSKAFDNAIKEAISQGPPILKKAQEEADNFYSENIVPFNSKFVQKVMANKIDTDAIPKAFIRAKADDRINLLNHFSKIAPNSMKYLMRAYLEPALNAAGSDESTNPFILHNIIKDSLKRLPLILEKSKDLNSEKASEEIRKFMLNMKNNSDALKFMENPKTGAQNVLQDTAAYLTQNISSTIKDVATANVPGIFSKIPRLLLMKAESANLYKKELPEELIKQTEKYLSSPKGQSMAEKLKKATQKTLISVASADTKSNNETE